MTEQKIAVIGCGVWGRNIVRNFYNLNVLDTVCDIDEENLNKVTEQYTGVKVTKDFHDIINNKEITGVCVVTPSHTHYKMVKAMLEAGKNVYVEKPISTVAQEARDLSQLAHEKGLILMVGHLLLYHPAVNRLKMLIEEGALGEIVYAQSDRLNVNYFKNDRSVMWDLAPHDVSMISYVTGKEPLHVISAVGCSSDKNEIMDITHIGIQFEDGVIGQISDSWITPRKHVQLLVRGTKATAILDDTLPENKLVIFDNFVKDNKQDIKLDYLEIEPLKLECQHFISCCSTGKKARSDGDNGFMVTQILEEAEKMMLGDRVKKLDKVDFALSRTKKVIMNIKDNIANIVSITRIFVAYGAIALLYNHTTWAYALAFLLTAIAFAMDGLDGYLARKLNQSSKWGSVLDILGDRIVEVSYWTVFAVMGWISIFFPLVCVARAFTTDGIRSVALSKGYTAFGETSMQSSKIGKFICASKFMRISYAVAKVAAFMLLIVVNTPGFEVWNGINCLRTITMILAWIAIIFCIVRAIPVVAESGKLFNEQD